MTAAKRVGRGFSVALVAAIAIAAEAGLANAQLTSAQQNAIKTHCRSDFMSHCSGVTPGGTEALTCLQEKVASLSAACQQTVRSTMSQPAATAAPSQQPSRATVIDAAVMLRACKLDLVRHCRDAGIGDGQKLACLTSHSSSLSFRCRAALKITSPLR